MVVKVGSAGPVVDSVIQYQQNNIANENKESHAEKRDEKKKVSHSAGLAKITDGITSSSERAHIDRTLRANVAGQGNGADAEPQKIAPMRQDAVSIETRDGEIIENRKSLELSEEAVKITVDDVNKKIAPSGAEVEFSYHEKTGRYSFKVMDKETGEILREVPPQKSLDMVAKMFEMVGLIIDEKL